MKKQQIYSFKLSNGDILKDTLEGLSLLLEVNGLTIKGV